MIEALTIHLEQDLLDRLAQRARRRGISMEEEARSVLEKFLQQDWQRFWEEAAQIRQTLAGKRFDDSAELIREDRDR
jgi:plasmid stability protein